MAVRTEGPHRGAIGRDQPMDALWHRLAGAGTAGTIERGAQSIHQAGGDDVLGLTASPDPVRPVRHSTCRYEPLPFGRAARRSKYILSDRNAIVLPRQSLRRK